MTTVFCRGYANVENEIKMSEDHLLHGGSTGKTFVSAITMQMLSENAFRLDDKIAVYLSDYEWFDRLPNASDITLRDLLQHTSGIERYEFKESFTNELLKDPNRYWELEDLVQYVLDDPPLFAAGDEFSYADTNYILLAMIIEKVSNEAYNSILQERILSKLTEHSFTPTDTRKIEGMAQGYIGADDPLGFDSLFLNKDGYAIHNMQFEQTGGGLAFKTKDYSRWLKNLYEGNAFDLDRWKEQYFDGVEAKGVGGEYGLGVQIMKIPDGGVFYGHSGFFPGYFTLGMYCPETKRAIALQLNSSQMQHIRPFYAGFIQMMRMIAK